MSKTLEQAIHEADLPTPAPGGEDFSSYVSRVAHCAAFIGAAWAIANGPQSQGPQMPEPPQDEPLTYEQQPSQDQPVDMTPPVIHDLDDHQPNVQPGSVQRSEPVTDYIDPTRPPFIDRHQDFPMEEVRER